MNIVFSILILLLSTNDASEQVHEFHLSKSTINYDSEEESLQITMNMFIDDLELALSSLGGDSLQICTRREKDNAEDYIYTYILDRLIIDVDGKNVVPEFIGKEPSDDLAAVWCYLEVTGVSSFSQVDLTNTIMVDLFDDQKNMTNIQKDKNRVEDILFTPEKTTQKVEIDD